MAEDPDDPPTLVTPDDAAPRAVTIVDAVPGGARIEAKVVGLDEDVVTVGVGDALRRFSRVTGFELKGGGSWSTWRLAGADFRLLRRKR